MVLVLILFLEKVIKSLTNKLSILEDPTEKFNLAKHMEHKVRELALELDEYKKFTVEPLVKEPIEDYRDPKSDPALWGDKFSPGWC